ncbi:MAG: hypothetical protein KAJ14_00965, partial [Candidatus Omnitrophica bacterium]|nr:hypothetical protein [Candidatus Omnitrophota bacterium]
EELELPQGKKLQGKLVLVRREGAFEFKRNGGIELESLYVYFSTTEEEKHIVEYAKYLNEQKLNKTKKQFETWLEEINNKNPGHAEVWSIFFEDFDSLVGKNYLKIEDSFKDKISKEEIVAFTSDLLAPLAADKDVMLEIKEIISGEITRGFDGGSLVDGGSISKYRFDRISMQEYRRKVLTDCSRILRIGLSAFSKSQARMFNALITSDKYHPETYVEAIPDIKPKREALFFAKSFGNGLGNLGLIKINIEQMVKTLEPGEYNIRDLLNGQFIVGLHGGGTSARNPKHTQVGKFNGILPIQKLNKPDECITLQDELLVVAETVSQLYEEGNGGYINLYGDAIITFNPEELREFINAEQRRSEEAILLVRKIPYKETVFWGSAAIDKRNRISEFVEKYTKGDELTDNERKDKLREKDLLVDEEYILMNTAVAILGAATLTRWMKLAGIDISYDGTIVIKEKGHLPYTEDNVLNRILKYGGELDTFGHLFPAMACKAQAFDIIFGEGKKTFLKVINDRRDENISIIAKYHERFLELKNNFKENNVSILELGELIEKLLIQAELDYFRALNDNEKEQIKEVVIILGRTRIHQMIWEVLKHRGLGSIAWAAPIEGVWLDTGRTVEEAEIIITDTIEKLSSKENLEARLQELQILQQVFDIQSRIGSIGGAKAYISLIEPTSGSMIAEDSIQIATRLTGKINLHSKSQTFLIDWSGELNLYENSIISEGSILAMLNIKGKDQQQELIINPIWGITDVPKESDLHRSMSLKELFERLNIDKELIWPGIKDAKKQNALTAKIFPALSQSSIETQGKEGIDSLDKGMAEILPEIWEWLQLHQNSPPAIWLEALKSRRLFSMNDIYEYPAPELFQARRKVVKAALTKKMLDEEKQPTVFQDGGRMKQSIVYSPWSIAGKKNTDGGSQEKTLEKIITDKVTEGELNNLKKIILRDRVQREAYGINEGNIEDIFLQRLKVFKRVYSVFETKRKELRIDVSLTRELWEIYIPLAEWVVKQAEVKKESGEEGAYILGLNGAQGSGKTTMNEFLRVILGKGYGKNAAGFSIDDIYKTYEDRESMGEEIHSLFAIRGVPGTHDVELGIKILEELKGSGEDSNVRIPQFDKMLRGSKGDRKLQEEWPIVKGKVDIVIFEGWCVGVRAQENEELKEAINGLEREEDKSGIWRRKINEEVKGKYAELFEMLDSLVMIKIPGMETVFRNREEQEKKAREDIEDKKSRGEDIEGLGAMSKEEVIRFVNFFERLTRHMLDEMPKRADLVFEMGEEHRIEHIYSKEIQDGGRKESRTTGAVKVIGVVNGRNIRDIIEEYGLSTMVTTTDADISAFRLGLAEAIKKEVGEVDIGLLIPYYQEDDNASHVLRTMIAGYEEYFADKRGVVIAVGTKAAGEAGERARVSLEEEAKKYKGNLNIIILHLDEIERGKGRGLRWAFTVTHALKAKAILHLDADLYTEINGVSSREKAINWKECPEEKFMSYMESHRLRGLSPYWIKAMVEPVLERGVGLMLPHYVRPIFDGMITKFLMYIWAVAFYKVNIEQIIAGDFCLSNEFVDMLLKDEKLWK